MTKAPQKIWACVPANGKRNKEALYGWTTRQGLKAWREEGDEDDFGQKLDYVEYIRLDLHEAAVAAARAEGMREAAKIARDAANRANMVAEDMHHRGLDESAFHARQEAEAIANVAWEILAAAEAAK